MLASLLRPAVLAADVVTDRVLFALLPRVMSPAAETARRLAGLDPACRSSKFALGDALVFDAKITALPAPGLPLVVTLRVLPVLAELSSLSTPPVDGVPLLFVKVYKNAPAPTEAAEVSAAFLAMNVPPLHDPNVNGTTEPATVPLCRH